MDELSRLILAHTMIGMTKTLNKLDTAICLCGKSLKGMSAHAEHAKHLAEELTKAGYGLKTPLRLREFDLGDPVETCKHDKGVIVGWTMHSTGGVTYQVLIPNRGSYTYSPNDLHEA